MTTAIVAKHIALLHHTLGLTPERRESYRNHFVAGEGHHDQVDLLALETAGLMTQTAAPKFCEPGDVVFRATEQGKALALDNLPLPPKYSRYEQYLRSECCESFAEWLGIEVPERVYGGYPHHERTRGMVHLRSSRATGEWKPTLKEAKAGYKAALAARRVEAKAWKEASPC